MTLFYLQLGVLSSQQQIYSRDELRATCPAGLNYNRTRKYAEPQHSVYKEKFVYKYNFKTFGVTKLTKLEPDFACLLGSQISVDKRSLQGLSSVDTRHTDTEVALPYSVGSGNGTECSITTPPLLQNFYY